MNYIIYDLEWNQPASLDTAVMEPVYLDGEIIEIGAVKLDEAFRIVDQFKAYISPCYYKKMHHAVASLTGIYDKLLAKEGRPFPEVFEQFMNWCGAECTLMTWSMSDLPVLIDNMLLYGMDVSMLPPCCDIQRIFGREIERSQTRYSLDSALSILKEKPDPAHDALNDAKNTAKICDHLDLDQYIGEYISHVFPQTPDGIGYETKQEILLNESLRQYTCPMCGQTVQCEPWVPSGRNTQLAYGICDEDDEFLLELAISHQRDGRFTAKRILFGLSDDLWDVYLDRKELLSV